jgi:hypothetical protein
LFPIVSPGGRALYSPVGISKRSLVPILQIGGDAAGAVKAIGDVNKEAAKTGPVFDKTAMAAQKLELAAARIVKENLTPQEKYNYKIKELETLLRNGKLTFDQAGVAAQRYGEQLDQAGRHGEAAFGTHALGHLVEYAAGLTSIHRIIEFMNESLREQAELKKKAAENVTAGMIQAGDLQTVSPTQKDYAHNLAVGRHLMDAGIVPRNQQGLAWEAAKGMAEARLNPQEEKFVFETARRKLVGPNRIGQVVDASRSFQEAYGPKAGSFQHVMNELMRGSAETLGLASPEDIATQTADPSIASKMNAAGITPDQAIASYAAIARTAKTKRAASSRLKEFFEKNGHGLNDLTAPEKAKFDQILKSLRGVGESPMSDFMAGDPALFTSRGTEEAEADYSGELERNTQEASSLYHRLHVYNRGNIRRNLGYGLAGGLGEGVDRMIESTGATLGQEESGIRTAAEYADAHRDTYPDEFIGELKQHFARQEELLQRQTNIMEEDRNQIVPSGRQETGQ